MTATFYSDARTELAGAAVALKLTQITYKGASVPPAWPASAAAEPLPAPLAEPEYAVVPKSEKELSIKARRTPQEIGLVVDVRCMVMVAVWKEEEGLGMRARCMRSFGEFLLRVIAIALACLTHHARVMLDEHVSGTIHMIIAAPVAGMGGRRCSAV